METLLMVMAVVQHVLLNQIGNALEAQLQLLMCALRFVVTKSILELLSVMMVTRLMETGVIPAVT